MFKMEVLQLTKMCLTPLFVIVFVNFFVLQVDGGVCQGDPSKIVSMCQQSSVISSVIDIDTSFFSNTIVGQRCTCEIVVNSTSLSINTLNAPSSLECGTVVTFKLAQNPKIECTTSKEYIDTSIENKGVVEISTTSSTVTDTGYCIQVFTEYADETITMNCYENEVTMTTEIPPMSVMKELLQQNNQTSEAVLDEISRNPNASVLFEPLMSSSELMSLLNNTEQIASTKETITPMPYNNNTESISNTTETIPVEEINAVIKQYNGSSSNESDISTVLFEPINSTDIPLMVINTTYTDIIQNVTNNEYTDMNNSSSNLSDRTTSTETYSELVSRNAQLISAHYKTTTENVPSSTTDLSPMNLFSSHLVKEYLEKEKVTENQLNNAIKEQVTTQSSSLVPDIQPSRDAWSLMLPDDTNNTNEIISNYTDILSSATEQDLSLSETYQQSTIYPSTSDTILSSDFDFEYLKPTMSWEISNLKSLSSALAPSAVVDPIAEITSNDMAFMSIVPSTLAIVPTKSSEVTTLTQATSITNATSSTLSVDEPQSKAGNFTPREMLPPQVIDVFPTNTETIISNLLPTTSAQNVEETTLVAMSTEPKTTTQLVKTTKTTVATTEPKTTTQQVETTKTTVATTEAETTTQQVETIKTTIATTEPETTTQQVETTNAFIEAERTTEQAISTPEETHVNAIPVIPETEHIKEHGHETIIPETGHTNMHEHIPVIPETRITKEHEHIPAIPETVISKEHEHIPDIPESRTTKDHEHIPVMPETTNEHGHEPVIPESVTIKEHEHITQKSRPMKIMPIVPDQNIKQNIRLLPPVNQNELDKIFSGVSDNYFTTKVPNTVEVLEPQGATEEEDVLSEETVTIIVIGSVIGILALVAVIVILTTILQKRKRSSNMAASKDLELNGKGIDNPLMELERQNAVNSSFGQNGHGTIHEEPELETTEVEGVRNGTASSVPESKPEDIKTQETNDAKL